LINRNQTGVESADSNNRPSRKLTLSQF